MLDKLLRLGEGRMVKRLKGVAQYVNTLSDDIEKLSFNTAISRMGSRFGQSCASAGETSVRLATVAAAQESRGRSDRSGFMVLLY